MRTPDEFVRGLVLEHQSSPLTLFPRSEREWPELWSKSWREQVKLRIPAELFLMWSFEFRADHQWHFQAIRQP